MRAALVDAAPSLAYHFGIRPWEIERLTALEIKTFLDQIPRQSDKG